MDQESKSNRANTVGAVVGAVVLALTIGLPVFIVAVPLGRFVAWRLSRNELLIVLAASVAATFVAFEAFTIKYFRWLFGFYTGKAGVLDAPILPILCFAVFWMCLYGLTMTKFAALVPWMKRRAAIKEKGIIPTDKEKDSTRLASPPVEKLLVDPDAHSIMTETSGPRQFAIGVDSKGKPVKLSEAEVGTHGLIFGSTGSGKSETIKALAGQLLDLGWDVCLVDLKEDTQAGGLSDWCKIYGQSHSVPVQSLALSSPSETWFNPLLGLSIDEARSAVLALQEFDDAYWSNINKKMLGQLLTLMYRCHEVLPSKYEAPDMYRLGRIFSDPKGLPNSCKPMFEDLVRAGLDVTRDEFSALLTPSRDEQSSATGYGAKIVQMYETEAGRLVLRSGPGRVPLDVTQPGICYIGLNSLGTPDMAKVISTAALVRLCAYAGARTTGKEEVSRRRAVIIDEANWVDRRQIANLLSRARSAGIAVFLATQGPLDWSEKSDVTGMGISYSVLLQNVNVVMIGVQKDFESAEVCAEIIGKEDQIKVTERLSGHWTALGEGLVQEREDYKISPEDLRSRLRVGEVILKVFQPKHRIEWVKVAMRDPSIGPRRH